MKLYEAIFQVCINRPQGIAFESETGFVTYGKMLNDVHAWVERLTRIGLITGDRLAVCSAPPYEVFTLELACSRLRITLVFLESYISPSSAEWHGAITGSSAHWSVNWHHGTEPEWDRTNVLRHPDDLERAESDRFILLQARTSGTTGRPKGVCLSEDALLHAVANTRQIANCDVSSKGMLLYEPLGLISQIAAFSTFLSGGTLVDALALARSPEDIPAFIECQRITHAVLVPRHIGAALADPQLVQRDLSCLKVVMYGAAPVTYELIQRARAAIPCRWLQCYGMTETTGPVCWLLAEDQNLAGFSVGTAAPGCLIRICDTETEDALPNGQDGEIWIGGSLLMEGYWDADRNQIVSGENLIDGWLRTGDIGHLTEAGHLIMKGRAGEEIVCALGYTIHPSEIEEVLRDVPEIEEISVFGYEMSDVGTMPIAVCHVKSQYVDAVNIIFKVLFDKLDQSKQPSHIVIVRESFPRGSNGKVQKARLKASLREIHLIPVEHTKPHVASKVMGKKE